MSLGSGFQFIIFLFLFGFTNYLMMLKRYQNDVKRRKLQQKNREYSLKFANLFGEKIRMIPCSAYLQVLTRRPFRLQEYFDFGEKRIRISPAKIISSAP